MTTLWTVSRQLESPGYTTYILAGAHVSRQLESPGYTTYILAGAHVSRQLESPGFTTYILAGVHVSRQLEFPGYTTYILLLVHMCLGNLSLLVIPLTFLLEHVCASACIDVCHNNGVAISFVSITDRRICGSSDRTRILFRHVFQAHHRVWRTVTTELLVRAGLLHECMNIWYIYKVCMSPAPSGNLVKQHFKLSDALEIRDGIIFDFYPGLPHMYMYYIHKCDLHTAWLLASNIALDIYTIKGLLSCWCAMGDMFTHLKLS